MMKPTPARVNVRLLVTIGIGAAILCVGGLVGHRVRKKVMADSALAAGNEAWQRDDFSEAARQFHRYLSRYPDDTGVLTRYAEANLSIRPVQPEKVGAAISAYRRLFRQSPEDATTWKELARLYNAIGQWNEAAYVCRQRLAAVPNDLVAKLWLGRSLYSQRNLDEAKAVLEEVASSAPATAEETRVCVQASGILAGLLAQGQTDKSRSDAQVLLDACVNRFGESAEARLQRARFRRSFAGDKTLAQEDLVAAERLSSEDPSVRLGLADEWLQWNELERASVLLSTLGDVASEVLDRFEIDQDAWTQTHAMSTARMLIQQHRGPDGAQLAARTLAKLFDHRRLSFLPVAVELYLANGDVAEAAALAAEFHQAVEDRPDAGEQLRDQSAVIRASVASAEGSAVEVIKILDANFGGRKPPQKAQKLLWQALTATGQERRARQVLDEAVRGPQRDPELLLAAARSHRNTDWRGVYRFASEAAAIDQGNHAATVFALEARVRTTQANNAGEAESVALRRRLDEAISQQPRSGDFRILLAGLQYRQGNDEDALRTLQAAVADCDADPEIDLALVNLLARLKRTDEARVACDKGVERHPKAASLRIRLAELQVNDNEKSAALATLRAALTIVDRTDRLTVASAIARLGEDAQRDAIVILDEIAREYPFDIRPRLALLELATFRRDKPAAQRTIDELKDIEGTPRGTHWRVEQARLWIDADEVPTRRHELEELLAEASRNDPTWPSPVVLLGRMYESAGRLDSAEAAYRRFIDTQSNTAPVIDRLLRLLEQQRRFADADQVLARLPRDAARWRDHRLSLSLNRGDYPDALADLQRRALEAPEDVHLKVLIARLGYQESQDAERALAELDRLAAENPDLREIAIARSSILQSAGRMDEALTLLNGEVERRNDAVAFMARGTFFVSREQWTEAEADLKKAKEREVGGVEARLTLARFYQARESWPDAVREFDEAFALQPKDDRVVLALTTALIQSPQPEHHLRANRLATEQVAAQPRNVEFLILAADAKIRINQENSARDAAELLDRAIAADPRSARAYLRRLELARNKESRTSTMEILTRALAALPDDLDLRLIRAGLEREDGNYSVSRELARGVLEESRLKSKTGSDDPFARRQAVGAASLLADLALRDRTLEEAGEFAREAMRIGADHELAQLTHARWLIAADRREEAISELEAYRAGDAGSKSVGSLLLLAELHRARGDIAAAESCLRQAAAIAPKDVMVQIGKFQLAASRGRFEELLNFVRGAKGESSTSTQVLLVAASLLASSGQQDALAAAEEVYSAMAVKTPDLIEAVYGLAHTRYLRGNVPGAIEVYRRALAQEPFHAQSLNNLAWILADDEKQFDEALALADKGVRRFPEDPYLLDTRGVIYTLMNRLSEAKQDFERCLALRTHTASSRAQTLVHAGRLYVKLGDNAAARNVFNEARQIDERDHVLNADDRAEIIAYLGSSP